MTDLTPDSNGQIDLADLVKVLADERQVGQRADHAPTEGRVLVDSETGAVYLGDGTQWLTVASESGVTTPSLNTDQLQFTSE